MADYLLVYLQLKSSQLDQKQTSLACRCTLRAVVLYVICAPQLLLAKYSALEDFMAQIVEQTELQQSTLQLGLLNSSFKVGLAKSEYDNLILSCLHLDIKNFITCVKQNILVTV